MRRSIGSFNIQEAPCVFKLLKIGMFKFLFWRFLLKIGMFKFKFKFRAQNYFQMPSPSGEIDGEFFFFVKIGIIPSNSPYFLKKIKTFIPVGIPHPSQKCSNSPPRIRMTVKLPRVAQWRMLKLRINLRTTWKVIKPTKAQFLGNSCLFCPWSLQSL